MNVHHCRVLLCGVATAVLAYLPPCCNAAEADFYVSGIIGSSFATLTDTYHDNYAGSDGSINGSLFTAGGAAGYGFDRENGRLRLEVEGRGRDVLSTHAGIIDPGFSDTATWRVNNGWSVLANVWRDVNISEKVALYAGGGIGGGGYRLTVDDQIYAQGYNRTGGFAWQAGGGLVWSPSDRLDIDLGYRFFAVDTGSTPLVNQLSGGSAGIYTSSLSASEVLLTFRIYEPLAVLRGRR